MGNICNFIETCNQRKNRKCIDNFSGCVVHHHYAQESSTSNAEESISPKGNLFFITLDTNIPIHCAKLGINRFLDKYGGNYLK